MEFQKHFSLLEIRSMYHYSSFSTSNGNTKLKPEVDIRLNARMFAFIQLR